MLPQGGKCKSPWGTEAPWGTWAVEGDAVECSASTASWVVSEGHGRGVWDCGRIVWESVGMVSARRTLW